MEMCLLFCNFHANSYVPRIRLCVWTAFKCTVQHQTEVHIQVVCMRADHKVKHLYSIALSGFQLRNTQ